MAGLCLVSMRARCCSSTLAVLLEHPSWKMAGLLVIAVWCFCRAYYFAFYVVSRYADPG